MTDRIYAYTVMLDRDIREDDAEHITNALKMIKGVMEVTPLVVDPHDINTEIRIRRELYDKIFELFNRDLRTRIIWKQCLKKENGVMYSF